MPSNLEKPYVRIPREKSRRVKLSLQDRQDIIEQHYTGGAPIHWLARRYDVNKRLIQFILFPDREERNKKLRLERGGSMKYYDRAYNTAKVRECRRHRANILKPKEA